MGTKIDDRAAAKTFVPTPVAELGHVLEAILGQDIVRNGGLRGPAQVFAGGAIPLAIDRGHATEDIGLFEQLVVAMEIARIASALVTDLQELARPLRSLDHLLGLGQFVGHFLLAVDVQAGFHTGDGMLGVPEVGRRDDHRVDIALLLVQHLFVVDVRVVLVTISFQQPRNALLIVGFPDVTDRLETDAWNLQARFHQDLSLGTGTQQGYVDIIRLRATGLGENAGGNRQPRTHRRGGPQEAASIHTFVLLLVAHCTLIRSKKLTLRLTMNHRSFGPLLW